MIGCKFTSNLSGHVAATCPQQLVSPQYTTVDCTGRLLVMTTCSSSLTDCVCEYRVCVDFANIVDYARLAVAYSVELHDYFPETQGGAPNTE